jgi:hypoxanthine phosphoribosyltransferase
MKYFLWDTITRDAKSIATRIKATAKPFDLIIGLLRGGTVPATIISHYLDVPMMCIGVKTYDDQSKTGNVDAYQAAHGDIFNLKSRKSIQRVLVVDDLADTGDTFKYIKDAYAHLFEEMQTASLYIKSNTSFVPDYYHETFDANRWLVFPWEPLPTFHVAP